MKFFLPDWDDRVDPEYDFELDKPKFGRDPYEDDVYAHEFFTDDQCYDGILVSRSALSQNGSKNQLADQIGLKRLLRLPKRFELMGDCGAFGYIEEPEPVFGTDDVLEFYQRVGVDYGVSVDHIIFPAFPDQRDSRYRLTIDNAKEFLRKHREARFDYVPVGAVQGWDVASYRAAAREFVQAGYTMLAVGGLVGSRTKDVLAIARGIVDEVGTDIRLHLLGVARDSILDDLIGLGTYSIDSASPMRTAWTSTTKNYVLGTEAYTAIRVPFSDPRAAGRGERMFQRRDEETHHDDLARLERAALDGLRAYGRRRARLEDVLDSVAEYDENLRRRTDKPHSRLDRMERYRRTLKDRPWTRCKCRACVEIGIEVVIFRGNNRNRRRGFHNVREFYIGLKNRGRVAREIEPATLGL